MAWEWKLLNKVVFAEVMLVFSVTDRSMNRFAWIGSMMTAVFAPTVPLLFEALALSYKSLTSIT